MPAKDDLYNAVVALGWTPPAEPAPEPAPEPEPIPTPAPLTGPVPSAAQRAVLTRLWENGHPWMESVKAKSFNPPYAEFGQWDLIAFLATYGQSYAKDSIATVLANTPYDAANTRNCTREQTIWIAWMYSILKPHMTPEQDAQYKELMRHWGEDLILNKQGNWGTRLEDSDELIGHCLGLACIKKYVLPDLDIETGHNGSPGFAAMYLRLKEYCEAYPKEWIESDEYNDGSVSLLVYGGHMAGIEDFPFIAQWASTAAERYAWDYSDNLKVSQEWGDDEGPDAVKLWHRVGILAALAGFGYDPKGYAAGLIHKLTDGVNPDSWPTTYWIDLWRALLAFDPEAPFTPFVAPEGFYTTPVGVSIHRSKDHYFSAHAGVPLGVDHAVPYASTFDLHLGNDEDRVIDYVRGYAYNGVAHNTGLACGYGGWIFKDMTLLAANELSDGCVIATHNGGDFAYRTWMGQGLSPFCKRMYRRVQFTAPNKIIVADIFDGRHILPEEEIGYPPAILAYMQKFKAFTAVFHCPEPPRETSAGYEWSSQGRIVHLISDGWTSRRVVKCSPEWVGGYGATAQMDGWMIFLELDGPGQITSTLEVL